MKLLFFEGPSRLSMFASVTIFYTRLDLGNWTSSRLEALQSVELSRPEVR